MAACESLVEIDEPTNQLGTPQVFEDLQTANATLAGLYAAVRDNSVLCGAGYRSPATLLDSYADNLDCHNNDQNGVMDIYLNQQQESNSNIEAIWTTAYQQVYYANAIIYGAENSAALSDDDKQRIMGEALLIRSLIYFYLQQLFGDLPYTTSLDYEYNRSISRTAADLVLEQLVGDLQQAAVLLEDAYRDAGRIYPNRKTAQVLLARIHLLRKEWTAALQLADTILQSDLYQPEPDLNEVFHNTGKHIIWQLKPKNEGDAVWEATFYYFSDAAPRAYTLTDDLTAVFADNDLRKQAWMAETNFNGQSWYRPYKYKNLSGNTTEYSIVFRLEEVYFIKAEALAGLERYDEALPWLNATRERAGLLALNALSGDAFTNELLEEKRREFFAESGHRFLDLKRHGRLNNLSAVKPNWEEYKQVWPLPLNELLLNSRLAPQNPDYR